VVLVPDGMAAAAAVLVILGVVAQLEEEMHKVQVVAVLLGHIPLVKRFLMFLILIQDTDELSFIIIRNN
jgi:hypothetical protein